MRNYSGEGEKGGSDGAERWKRNLGDAETTKEPMGVYLEWIAEEIIEASSNVKLKGRRVTAGSKDSAMPPWCKSMGSQKEVTSTSKRGRREGSPADVYSFSLRCDFG